MINLPGCIVSLQELPKMFKLRKKSEKKINLIDKNISDLIIECFDRNKSCKKWYFKQLIYICKISYFALFSLRQPPNLTKLANLMIFQIWHSFKSATFFQTGHILPLFRCNSFCQYHFKIRNGWMPTPFCQSYQLDNYSIWIIL